MGTSISQTTGVNRFASLQNSSGTSDQKNSTENPGYMAREQNKKEENEKPPFVDRSAELSATLNCLAVNRAAAVKNNKHHHKSAPDNKDSKKQDNNKKDDDKNKEKAKDDKKEQKAKPEEFSSIKKDINIFYGSRD